VDVSVEIIEKPSVGEYELVAAPISIQGDWRTSIRKYLLNRELPTNINEVHQNMRAVGYYIYCMCAALRRSFS
jgi:hypothetical protein